jgi:DNA invertase Pin-like site-specific DNA recombinase
MRTSSAANTGADKDSEKRQRAAIEAYAKRAGLIIVEQFYDAAVSGADAIESRPGFSAMLTKLAGNGVRVVVVETASRFARDIIVQETGFRMLQGLGIQLVAADSPTSFVEDTPTAKMVRQILGVVSEFEKAMLVAKLKGARDRKRARTGKCEGRRSYAEMPGGPELIAAAKQLADQRPRLSLRQIAAELATRGYITRKGEPYSAMGVRSMIAQARRL